MIKSFLWQRAMVSGVVIALTACSGSPTHTSPSADETVHPEKWPKIVSPVKQDPIVETRITTMLQKMTVEQKVAQLIQPEIRDFTVADMRKYGFGSYLNGGGAFPNNDKYASMQDWVALADEMYHASMDASEDGIAIPTMWGTDAVHGHNNVIGATIFPHNIGLGAMHDPVLLEKIGAATATAVRVTGIDWLFAPTVAVVRDDRWGRTYEGYSEDPAIVYDYAAAMVRGIQGKPGDDFLSDSKAIATAKHFLGDGGTHLGVDQGNNLSDEQTLIDIHAQGYVAAIEQGVQSIMASFNSWHGQKMHGNKAMLTEVLKKQMGFDGLVVGDWDGHGQVPGCTNSSCAQAINAGVDIIMVPTNWQAMLHNTVAQVQSGEITHERLDDAVRRILRVKFRAGLFDGVAPKDRAIAGKQSLIGSEQHRQIAREAVRKSLVLLKNQHQLLPLSPTANILVAGSGAHNIGKQSGGWTISWQGTGNQNSDFPGGTSIFDGIQTAVQAAGGQVLLSENAQFSQRPDVAIVVFGENPYAEGAGDLDSIEYQRGNKRDLALLKKLQSQGIPVVSVFLTGRPLWINAELNASDAFVVAWLPGSEGQAVADVLFTDKQGKIKHDFQGKLSYSWPARDDQLVLNKGDDHYAPLYAYGYGLTYADTDTQGDELNEVAAIPLNKDNTKVLPLFDTVPQSELAFFVGDKAAWAVPVATSVVTTQGSDNLTLRTENMAVQEDARQLTWKGQSTARAFLGWSEPKTISEYLDSQSSLQFLVKITQAPVSKVQLGMLCGEQCRATIEISQQLQALNTNTWQTFSLDLACLVAAGADLDSVTAPFIIETDGAMQLSVASVAIQPHSATTAMISCQ